MRTPIAPLLAALAFTGCGATDSGGPPQPAATPSATSAVGADEQSVEAVEARLQALARQKDDARAAGDFRSAERLERAMRETEQALDEALEAEMGALTPFEKAVDSLPLARPPLYVEQFVLEEGSHELVVRTAPRRFFCGRSEPQRLSAVRAYYEQVRRTMTARGIDDFALVVDSTRATGDVKPLARAEGDVVTLTARGRGDGPC